MKRNWWYRFTFLLVVVVLSILFVLPTAMDFKKDSSYPVESKITLGLDLQGGLYMVLGIDFNKVFADEVKNWARKAEYTLNDLGLDAELGKFSAPDPRDPRHTLVVDEGVNLEEAKNKIREYYGSVLRLTDQQGRTLEYGLASGNRTQIEEQAVSKSIEVIRNRIDEFGVTEPEIVSQGDDRIIVQLPGVRNIDRAKELIGKTAKLEFKLVNDSIPPAQLQQMVNEAEKEGIKYEKGMRFSKYLKTLNEHIEDDLPEGTELVFQKKVNRFNNEVQSMVPFLVEKKTRLSGEALQDARVQFDQQKNQPYVSLDFKPSGADLFEKITGENVGKRLAIILDGNVYSAPNILTRIAGGRAQITLGSGNYGNMIKEAKDLAVVLRAGALPVELNFLEQRTVGPSLGADAIRKAEIASIVGSIVILLFIVFYYRVGGAIALVSLFVNVLIILAALVGLGATLTLPGIAGIALTVGMAIDASIIIYERIREEVRKGLSNYKAVENGFNQAFWTIIDANITTALAGLCLLNFGTGPIRGFAVTLLIGIVATIYSSYFVGRLLFEFYMNKVEGQELSI